MFKFFFRNEKKSGQTLIDYILLITVVLVIFLIFVAPGGIFHRQYNDTMMITLNTVNNIIADILNGGFSY